MKKFYNHDTISYKLYDDYNVFRFELNVPETYGIQFYTTLDAAIERFIKPLNSEKPVLIQVIGDFDLLKEADAEDRGYFITSIINLFIDALVNKNKKAEREKRLGTPKSLEDANLSTMSKMSIVNYVLKFPIFNIEVLDAQDNIIFSVF